MIEAVFFDVDHTLVDHRNNQIPESTLYAIKKLQQKEIKVFLATGRHRMELANIDLHDIIWDGYILLNGQLCYDRFFQQVAASPIHANDKKILESVFLSKKMPMFFVEEDRLYTNMHTSALQKAQDLVSCPMPEIHMPSHREVYQVTLFAQEDSVQKLVSLLSYSKYTGWNAFGCDIICKEGGKAKGIAKMLEYYGISKEKTLAFGDGKNDMDMLQFCQIGVAMGNAHAELKWIADLVTDDVDQDGILKALQHLHIL